METVLLLVLDENVLPASFSRAILDAAKVGESGVARHARGEATRRAGTAFHHPTLLAIVRAVLAIAKFHLPMRITWRMSAGPAVLRGHRDDDKSLRGPGAGLGAVSGSQGT